jgi:hypothetical protein
LGSGHKPRIVLNGLHALIHKESLGYPRLVLLPVWLAPPEDVGPTEVIDLTEPGGAAIRAKE